MLGDREAAVPAAVDGEAVGVRLGEDPAVARAALERCVAERCAQDDWLRAHPATVTWPGGQFASGRPAAGHPLRDVVADAYADATGAARARERGATYGSDLRLCAGAGIPTVQFGPGDVGVAHSAREHVSLREVVDTARALALTAARTAGVK